MAMGSPNAAFCALHLDDDNDYDDDEYEKKASQVFFKKVGSARGPYFGGRMVQVLARGVPLVERVLDRRNQAGLELENHITSWDPR
jgi:hypothetical protein